MPEFPPITTYFAPIFLAAVIWEWWAVSTGRAKGTYDARDAVVSMMMGFGNVIVNTSTSAIALWMLSLLWPSRLHTFNFSWSMFVIVFVAYDFVYYWQHRLAHRMRWFWMEHVTHHSSEKYNLTTALRQPWFGPFTGLIVLSWPLVLLGIHPLILIFVHGVNLVYQFWIHTESINKMPKWFEAVFNTPSHHRVHHATNPRYLDANYAGVFIIWDKIFGSFVSERDDDAPVYGIVKPVSSFNPLVVAYHELFSLFKDCLNDGFRPDIWVKRFINSPGWSPDGHHARSIELKRAFVEANPACAGEPGLPQR